MMTESYYEVAQTMPKPQAGRFAFDKGTGRILAGVGHSQNRVWTYPLNTPAGHNVVQEYAFDHIFQNGVFVGQGGVVKDDKETNFWVTYPDFRVTHGPVYNHIGQLRYCEPPHTEHLDKGIRFTYPCTWCDEALFPVLDEVRHIDVRDADDGIVCDTISVKKAAHGPITLGKTKYGSIGVRVQPQLLPPVGGEIIMGLAGEMRRGDAAGAKVNEPADFAAYEVELFGRDPFGLCIMILDNSESDDRTGPWLVRDYGMAVYNPTLNQDIPLAKDQSWTCALRTVAYDGRLTSERVERWRNMA